MAIHWDAYAVLHVDPQSDRDTISRAYRALARQFHPDGATPNRERMAQINQAYDRIKTPAARERYDSERRAGIPVGPGRDPAHGAPEGTSNPVRSGGIAARRAAREDATVIEFGRYAGWRIVDLARVDPDYLRWLSRHSAGLRYREAIGRCLQGDREVGRRASIRI